jgi:two-component system invasion response regulator UvrY
MTGHPIHVALADTNTLVRNGIKILLQKAEDIIIDFDFDNTKEYFYHLEAADKLPDVCVIDINMQKLTSYELCRKIKKEFPKLKILIMSPLNTRHSVLRMMANGVNGYLLYNSEPKELITAIREIDTKGYYFSEIFPEDILNQVKKREITLLGITARQVEFLSYCCTDLNYQQIAEKMNVNVRTVDGYRDILFQKFKVYNRASIVVYAIKAGYIALNNIPVGNLPVGTATE